MDNNFLSNKLKKIQESGYFSNCNKECRKLIKDNAKNLGLNILGKGIGTVITVTTGAFLMSPVAKAVLGNISVLIGENGLFGKLCSVKCILKNIEKQIRRNEHKNINDVHLLNEYDKYKELEKKLQIEVFDLMEKIKRKDMVRYDKLKRLYNNILDSVELFSI